MPATITLFTCPKPFSREPIAVIQHNALQSWLRLGEGIKVILAGNEPGVAEAARQYGFCHLPEVPQNQYGTPLVDGIFTAAEQTAEGEFLIYVNSDIILLDDFLPVLGKIQTALPQFLAVGRRWNLDITVPLDFVPGWQQRLRERTLREGVLFTPFAIDYFAYTRTAFPKRLPPFALGRFAWDGHLLGEAAGRNVAVIDVSTEVMAIHQNHDYVHIRPGIMTAEEAIRCAEAERNHAYTPYAGKRICATSHVLCQDQIIVRDGNDLILENLYLRLDAAGALLRQRHFAAYFWRKAGDFWAFFTGQRRLQKLSKVQPRRYAMQLANVKTLLRNHLRSIFNKLHIPDRGNRKPVQ